MSSFYSQHYMATVAPGLNDDSDNGFTVGCEWIDTATKKAYICVKDTPAAAEWPETTATGGGGGPADHADAYAASTQALTVAYTDVVVDTLRESAGFTLATNELTTVTAGKYLVVGRAAFSSSSAQAINGLAKMQIDTGGGYADVAGTEGGNAGEDSSSPAHIMPAILDLSVGDKIKLRAKRDSGTIDLRAGSAITITPIGAEGAQGPTGSGSTVTVKDEGVSVTGTPHSNLNFTGALVTVTDEGGGQAKVDISPNLSSWTNGSATSTTETSSTYVAMDSMGITPGAGTYLVNASTSFSADTSGADIKAALFANGSEVANTERENNQESSIYGMPVPVATHCVVTVAAAQVIELRWKTSAGTATALVRSIDLVKIA